MLSKIIVDKIKRCLEPRGEFSKAFGFKNILENKSPRNFHIQEVQDLHLMNFKEAFERQLKQMERYSMFGDGKTQYCKENNFLQISS